MHRHAGRAAALGFAVLLAAAVSLPAVWWEPLHVDEAITLEYAPESPPEILRDVFVERGGAPIFFLLEHVSLQWPGGLAGLRLPSFVFFLAAVALSAPVARQLGGRNAAILLPPLLAVAPLAVRLATFARMYALFLAGVLLAVWLLLRAVERRDRGAWILAGVVAGTLVYVHPIAPLYAGLALATAYLRSGLQLRAFLRSARPGLLALALVSAPYLYALAVLGRRYGVGSPESSLATSSSDRSVPAESLVALTHDARAAAAFLLALALWGLIATVRSARGTGIALALWIAVPIAFFSLVPSETNFFARYLLPALPFFLLLVVLGCLAAGRLVRQPLPVAIGLITAIVVWGAVEAGSRLEHLHGLRLGNAVDTIAGVEDPVLFSSAGAAVAGRPALLLDAYGALELPAATLVEELPAADPGHVADIEKRGIAATRDFVAGPPRPGRGVWILSGSPRQVDRATRRLVDEPGLEVRRISPALLLVHSAEPLPPRRLVEQAIAVRKAWLGPDGRERWSQTLIDIEREALGGIPDHRRALLIAAPVVAAGGLLLVRLARDVSEKPIHQDEAFEGLVSARPLREVLAVTLSDQGFAPLHFLLVHAVFVFDASQETLRWLSVAFALGAVALCFDVGRRLAGPIAGITAGLLAATSQLLAVYGTIGRMYALLAFAAALAADLFIRAVVLRTPGAAAWAAAGAWLLAASHPFGTIVVACEAAVAIALWRGRPLRAALPVALVSLAFLPLLVAHLRLADRFAVGPEGDAALASPKAAARLFVMSIGGLAGGRSPVFLLFVVLAGIGFATLVRRCPGFAAFAALALVVTPLLLILGQTEKSIAPLLQTRHLIYGLPFWTGLVGVGTARVLRDRTRAVAILGVSAVTLVAFLSPSAIADPRDLRSGTRDATAEPAAWLSTEIEPGDVLFPSSPVFLAALPAARHAVSLPRGSPTLDRPVFERLRLPVGSVHIAIPLDFARRVDAVGLQARLGPTYEVRVFDSWLLVTARGPFTDRRAVAEAAATGVGAAEQSIETSSPRLAQYFSQSLRTLCAVVRSLDGECPTSR